MKGRLAIIVFLGGLFFFCPELAHAQKAKKENAFKENHMPFGRRKKEKKNQHGTSKVIARRGGIFNRSKTNGNANAFATHSATGGKGFFYKLMHPGYGKTRNASLRKTKPGKVQNKEQSHLFHRLTTKNKYRHESIQARQRKDRARNRRRFGQ